ncbi:hypothetical protein O9992_27645 [Vibrio lentus]|nr:hypothetical protein [Vibrio lentus]
MIKANAMVNTIKRCNTYYDVLELNYLPLEKIAEQMPATLKMLREKYDEKITHILAINDLYIDYFIPSLEFNLEEYRLIPPAFP